KLTDVCVGFYGYDGREVGQAYFHAQMPSRISSLDMSKVRVKNEPSAIRYGGRLVFHGEVIQKEFKPLKCGILSWRYRWEDECQKYSVQMITLNALLAVISDGRVFADKKSMSGDLLEDLEQKLIPEMYEMANQRKKEKENV
ncbi:MAG: hypothetical protein V1944_00940, partial [Candidatus Aenigmatarchaeota archaeon]